MRSVPFFLFALLLASHALAGPGADEGTVRSEEFNFEVSMPDSIDWEVEELPKDKAYLKAHFSTEYADTDPPSRCDVQLMVLPLSREFARSDLKMVAEKWKDSMESNLAQTRDLKENKGTLGGQECWSRSLKGEYVAGVGHVSWDVARMGNYLYVLYVLRTYKAVDDEDLEEEIKEIRDSFKFLKVIEVKAHREGGKEKPQVPGGKESEAEIDPAAVKRDKMELRHWRLKLVKPQGLKNVEPSAFTDAEKGTNVVAKFTGRAEQTGITIWVHAQIATAQRYTVQQLAERYLKSWETNYKTRLDPEIDNNFGKKFPLAKECVKMKLVGRRTVPETTIWYLAQCKNDRQYQLRIYFTGAQGEKDWKKQIDDFLKNFKPQRK